MLEELKSQLTTPRGCKNVEGNQYRGVGLAYTQPTSQPASSAIDTVIV